MVTELGGGVSNTVRLIESDNERYVTKQSLARLRVEADWFSDRKRIWREAAALKRLAPLLPPGSVPSVLYEHREDFLFAMSAAPPAAVPWKSRLMAGETNLEVAENVGRLHAAIALASWESASWKEEFGDLTVFDELRLDPYYAYTAARHPNLEAHFRRAIARCREQRFCLVHGDWSPKNILVDGSSVMAIDFEAVHYGDPAFDAAFLLNHLLLKTFYRPDSAAGYRSLAIRYWETLAAALPRWMEAATIEHLPLLMLARIDGKSPAEYLGAGLRDHVRSFACGLLADPPHRIVDVFERIRP